MKETSEIINVLTYNLPYKLSNQIYNEFQSRLSESRTLISKYYNSLLEDIKTVELILALSIFHKRVITNLDAATKFYKTVNLKGGADTITINKYKLNKQEQNKLIAVVINYHNMLNKYSIPLRLLEFDNTKDLLRELINLKKHLNPIKDQNNSSDDNSNYSIDELPF